MTKTEQTIRESLAKRGHAYVVGKRAYDLVTRLEAAGALPGLTIVYGCENLNGPKWKSQWNNPRARLAYDVTITQK